MDTNNREPKYYRIKKELLEELASGKFGVGDEFYTEPKLQQRYGFSRGTVRKALDELQQEGYLIRMSGKGTFVARIARIPRSRDIEALSQLFRRAGLEPHTVVLEQGLVRAEDADGRVRVEEGFGIQPETQVIRICRLRLGNGEPLAIQTVYLQPEDCPGLLEEDLTQSLIGLYMDRYDRRLATADEILRVVPAEPQEARLLEIAEGTAVVIRDRISYDQENRPFEVLHAVDRAERFEYRYHIGEELIKVLQGSQGQISVLEDSREGETPYD
jgi:GntR family transcriptional regulator